MKIPQKLRMEDAIGGGWIPGSIIEFWPEHRDEAIFAAA
jgi:hypothetical protein